MQAVLLHFMERLAMCISELEALRETQGRDARNRAHRVFEER